ncbi:Iron-sulfur cluster assembly accessory protein [Rhodoblastus acidophilus]|uniref:Iron-sulfur cluster assembly accessory protein n=1 Tax=Rhodoblastus acidophilus TaxID=1074 RepID=A0A212RPG4_RHOAC|nr:iron-sulfur cluster assembly accessory protein [Rhodoblastus acidophilus]MCW2316102.1 iron-sulfur cluster assembly accessory protein [Rhodoblastus acidophilus]PPQ36711.1 iron-sulfur cluster assembly accessory protein [Rhodoblastus acidophilus]RAI21493.1 iron-sulfur cluster assembly accessory protein [Rhodoblastus acidophilus]SNB74322.1 Iron-sulfur cluster assembly accessory protein [Rhodoblastus acidophilus]
MTAFTVTPKAHRFMRMMVMSDGGPGAGFRLAVTPGGCSGLSADIAVLAEPLPGDATVVHEGVKLFLPAESRMLLQGVTIDFADTPTSSGLVFHDPKQQACCSSH